MDGVTFPTVGSLVIVFRSGLRVRPMHLFGRNPDHDYYFELLDQEEQDAQSITRCSTTHHGDVRAVLVRTELVPLLIVPPLAHHPQQVHAALPGHRPPDGVEVSYLDPPRSAAREDHRRRHPARARHDQGALEEETPKGTRLKSNRKERNVGRDSPLALPDSARTTSTAIPRNDPYVNRALPDTELSFRRGSGIVNLRL